MKKKCALLFKGTDITREDFLNAFIEFLSKNSLLPEKGLEPCVMFFKEIVKNIYDHAHGKGEAHFSLQGDKVIFYIKDFGTESFDLKKIRETGSTKVGNGFNFGTGISAGAIKELARCSNIRFRMRTAKGFSFCGVYRKK